ncbi:MAG: hypothetical protein VX951_03480 [Planctomycetota bacterium]|nr:hypothetical protein [Planctomycetota bacterium]
MSTPESTDSVNARLSERSTLRRELFAILVLYLTQCALPVLIGLAFGPECP